jgi:nucleotide-binding universal stress UspA family protein
MKSILIPVDFSAASRNTLHYIADFSHDFHVEEILLLKVYHVPLLSQLLPSPDMLQLGVAEMAESHREAEIKFQALVEEFKLRIKKTVTVNAIFVTDKLLPAVSRIGKLHESELIVIGNALDDDPNNILKEQMVPIARQSVVPVLLIPSGVTYHKLERVLLPTSFENLERLKSFKKLCKSQAWLKADIIVLNVDAMHRHDEIAEDDNQVLDKYLDNFQYHIEYSYGSDVAKDILKSAQEHQIQVILALPGRHSFFHNLTSESVTKSFALDAHFPVLLLK